MENEIQRLNKALIERGQEVYELRALVRKGKRVVDDFLPNIGKCVLQDYQQMNEFLVEAAKYERKG